MTKIKLSRYIKKVFETPPDTGSWFGYYNYDTLNYNQSKLLSNRTLNDARKIEQGMTIDVGYYDIPSGNWHRLGTSDSYNWPQGAMLQWLPGIGNENKVIFNTSNGIHNIAKIVNIETQEEKTINWSIYGLTPDGKKSITLNFERSHWCRAYHYESIANEQYNVRVAEDDGVFEIDLENNKRRRIISIQDIINSDKEEYFVSANHWIEHIMISPSGRRFCFLHRFTIGSLDDYETRLFIANIDGSNLQIVKGWRDYYWSHFGWNGDDEFVLYAYKSNKHQQVLKTLNKNSDSSNKILSPLKISSLFAKKCFHSLPQKWQSDILNLLKGQMSFYQYYKLVNDVFVLVDTWNEPIFNIDGHPSFTEDGRYMITDSYPDRKQYRRLIIYDTITKKSLLCGKLYAGLYNKPGCCDLHPKLCKNNNYLVVDTAYDGKHHMIIFRINWDKIKEELKK